MLLTDDREGWAVFLGVPGLDLRHHGKATRSGWDISLSKKEERLSGPGMTNGVFDGTYIGT